MQQLVNSDVSALPILFCDVDNDSRGASIMSDTAPFPEDVSAAFPVWQRELALTSPNRHLLSARLATWLDSLGLHCNPFDGKYLDAGADANLSSYLVGHEAFAAIAQNQPAMVFAPVGGGKSAFRVRLARACRVGEGGRRILPVIYTLPKPHSFINTTDLYERHLYYILRSIGVELLFALAYKPDQFLDLRLLDRRRVAGQLAAHFPGDLLFYLEQITSEGELSPLVKLIDPSADRLIAQPSTERLRAFCAALATEVRAARKQIAEIRKQSTEQRFLSIVTLVKQTLKFEGLYLLIDGIDAYVESVTGGRRQLGDILAPLLTKTSAWSFEKFFPKYFLPADLVSGVRFSALLQPGTIIDLKLVSIEWTKENLNTVLQERLRFASQGRFTNLDAICAPTLRNVQEQLLEVAAPLPREVLALAEQLLLAHVARLDEPALLEPIDLEMAIAYHRHGSFQQAVAA